MGVLLVEGWKLNNEWIDAHPSRYPLIRKETGGLVGGLRRFMRIDSSSGRKK